MVRFTGLGAAKFVSQVWGVSQALAYVVIFVSQLWGSKDRFTSLGIYMPTLWTFHSCKD